LCGILGGALFIEKRKEVNSVIGDVNPTHHVDCSCQAAGKAVDQVFEFMKFDFGR
jgi:hypothetical protein